MVNRADSFDTTERIVDAAAREAFDTFARARMAALLRFGNVLTGNREEAADLVQEALARTANAWPRLINREDPEGYVRRVMVNRQTTVWKRRRREVLVPEPADRASQSSEPQDLDLWRALATLPRRQRAVLVLRYYEDLTEAQTAAVLGCSVGTVKSQTFKALAKLREPDQVAALRTQGSPS